MQIKDRKSELALLETLDSGKPLDEASGDMVTSVCILHHGVRCVWTKKMLHILITVSTFYIRTMSLHALSTMLIWQKL